MSSEISPVTHVIFDVDGLLLDTETLYTKATQRVVNPLGKEYRWELKVKCMGMKGDIAAQIIIDELQLPLTVSQYMEGVNKEHDILFPTATLLPDTEKLYTIATERVAALYGKTYPWELKLSQMGHRLEECAKIIIEDTVEVYQVCHDKVLLPFGFNISFSEIMALMGLSSIEVADCICARFQLPLTSQDYKQRLAVFYPQVFPFVNLMKGAEKLVRHLHSKKIPIAIASGGAKDNFELKTTNHKELFSLFNHSVLASSDPDVKAGKPSPDVFLVCAQRFPDKPDPKKCLVFEDAPNGVSAAVAAHMQVVMVPDSRLDRNLTKGACLVLDSLEGFKPELFGLPAYDS